MLDTKFRRSAGTPCLNAMAMGMRFFCAVCKVFRYTGCVDDVVDALLVVERDVVHVLVCHWRQMTVVCSCLLIAI